MGPATCLTFLGIEIDSVKLELRLPTEKLRRVKQAVKEWFGRKAARRKELESLLGLLQHAAKVVAPGRRFVRRIIQALTGVKHRDHYVRLGAEIRSDLLWWHRFLDKWNGVGILPTHGSDPPWLRCIRFMGLRSNLEQPVAPVAMEQPGTGVADCSKGTPTDCSSNSGLHGVESGKAKKCVVTVTICQWWRY